MFFFFFFDTLFWKYVKICRYNIFMPDFFYDCTTLVFVCLTIMPFLNKWMKTLFNFSQFPSDSENSIHSLISKSILFSPPTRFQTSCPFIDISPWKIVTVLSPPSYFSWEKILINHKPINHFHFHFHFPFLLPLLLMNFQFWPSKRVSHFRAIKGCFVGSAKVVERVKIWRYPRNYNKMEKYMKRRKKCMISYCLLSKTS